MRRPTCLLVVLLVAFASGCALKAGQRFQSPGPASIKIGVTDRAALERVFGPPYQVGLDSGDPTWRWFYVERSAGSEVTKDLTVHFNPNGTVKSYSFLSNFPEDVRQLR
jgi:hypothetical protein